MIQSYTIPTDATTATLAELHSDILHQNPPIRPLYRWGDYTLYTVRTKPGIAAGILGVTFPANVRPMWQLTFGVERDGDGLHFTVAVEYYDAEIQLWTMGGYTDHQIADADEVTRRAQEWLRGRHPAAEALLEIDRQLLGRADVRGEVADHGTGT